MTKKIETYVENNDLNEIMLILEELDDEKLAVELLKEFNDKTKVHGQLILDMNSNLDNEEWKVKCDKARQDVEAVVQRIKSLK
ncbi:hypothetical protein M899_0742 [Bacteriovorax sp. BSW11_IV]|uniref:hypothetical protein n=1 Tax=Bacteriovorax sp. BSW11_IV TaxID=1353529 RepID=UPI00038A3137|nr:hypothetical protein [Bacteriovorax sp. BSW11_IV]EQC49181.1 hypothetical protein M899_0742 [Bacteriovorax sp. BSW11_IV]